MSESDATSTKRVTFQSCITGAVSSGALGYGCYLLTHSIALKFSTTPIPDGQTAHNIAVALRTLVLGSATLATGVFGLVTAGLIALGIQTLFTRQPQP